MIIPTVNFNNMQPTKDIESYTTQALEQLAEISPTDAYIGMNMESDDSGFWATLRIASSDIIFIDTQYARSPFAALDHVIGKGKDKVFDWCFGQQMLTEV